MSKAIVYRELGSPDVWQLVDDWKIPERAEGEVRLLQLPSLRMRKCAQRWQHGNPDMTRTIHSVVQTFESQITAGSCGHQEFVI